MNVMPDAKTSSRRSSGALIDAIVENMRQNLEELKYATLAPSRYTVYLSQAEHTRLEGIIPRLQAEAVRALDEELARINRPNWLRRSVGWLPGRRRPAAENAGPRWHIEFLVDTDGELAEPGDIMVHSDLMLAPDPELGVGERTRRITTLRSGDHTTTRAQVITAPDVGPAAGAGTRAATALARLTYSDNLGPHLFDIVRDETTIGRGGKVFPVDVRVSTSEDVSREHARIRRDPTTGQFFLIDLSTLGTTLNGRHVPRGVEERDGTKRENGTKTALPARARIGLADTVFLDFEAGGRDDPASLGTFRTARGAGHRRRRTGLGRMEGPRMTLRAAGATDVGVQRDVNEDRYLSDPDRGIFTVIDGVGGQAAGGRAADTALDVIRARLTTGNGAVPNRIREAITLANNEVHRQAASRPEWHGMACVLTAVMIDGDRARDRPRRRHAALQTARREDSEADAGPLACRRA